MARRRLAIYSEFESHAILDEVKLEKFSDGRSDVKVCNQLSKEVEAGERTVRGVLEALGVNATQEPRALACVEVAFEFECERHPGNWMTREGDKCGQCKME